MPFARDILTPDTMRLLLRIAESGSFAAAARAASMVPSALTYRVRQVEDALDVLLFERGARSVTVTEAGAELLRESSRLLEAIDAVAHRVKRVASGWEPSFTIAVDGLIASGALMDLVESFFGQSPPTRLRLREETLSGALAALLAGDADLAMGVGADSALAAGLSYQPIGAVPFVFAMAPDHPLSKLPEPLKAGDVRLHRAVAVADSATAPGPSFGLLDGQDVLTVPHLQRKLEAQLRGLGVGYLPEPMARAHLVAGRLVRRQVDQPERVVSLGYAWRGGAANASGLAMRWWLAQLESPRTRAALVWGESGQEAAAQL